MHFNCGLIRKACTVLPHYSVILANTNAALMFTGMDHTSHVSFKSRLIDFPNFSEELMETSGFQEL